MKKETGVNCTLCQAHLYTKYFNHWAAGGCISKSYPLFTRKHKPINQVKRIKKKKPDCGEISQNNFKILILSIGLVVWCSMPYQPFCII